MDRTTFIHQQIASLSRTECLKLIYDYLLVCTDMVILQHFGVSFSNPRGRPTEYGSLGKTMQPSLQNVDLGTKSCLICLFLLLLFCFVFWGGGSTVNTIND